ncbi:MAG TPA: hypothetical protein VGC79_21245 [Polyangiaceae bacterium]
MSGHGQHDADDLHSAHDDHHETSSDDFPADEPRSPGWLPLLGGGLFLAAIFAFVLCGSSDNDNASGPGKAAPAAAPAAKPAPRPIPALRPGVALPPGHAPIPTPRP